MESNKDKEAIRNAISDLIMDAAISKAIEDKRDLLRASMEYFLSGKRVNGEFDMALKKLMRWVENKTIEAVQSHYASQNEELRKSNNEMGLILLDRDGEIEQLKEDCAKLQSTIEELEKAFENNKEQFMELATHARDLESTIDEKNKEIEKLNEENKHFSAEITYLSDKYAISDYTKIIQDRNKEISELKYKLAKIKELKDQASDVKELFPLLQYISNNL